MMHYSDIQRLGQDVGRYLFRVLGEQTDYATIAKAAHEFLNIFSTTIPGPDHEVEETMFYTAVGTGYEAERTASSWFEDQHEDR